MKEKVLGQWNNGAFAGARTQDWQASTDLESDELPIAPSRPFVH